MRKLIPLLAVLAILATSALGAESTALIRRSQLCEIMMTRADMAEAMLNEGLFSDDAVGRSEALVVASKALLEEFTSASPEEIDPAFKDDLVFRAILIVLQETAGSEKVNKNREALDQLADSMNEKGRMDFADKVVLQLYHAVDIAVEANRLGLNAGELESLRKLDASKSIELRNWIFLQLAGKGPLYANRMVSRFGFWSRIKGAFKRRARNTDVIARRYDSTHWARLEAALARPIKTDLELAKDKDYSLSSLVHENGAEKNLFIALFWRRFTSLDLYMLLRNKGTLDPASQHLLEAREKEFKMLEHEGEVMAEMRKFTYARIGASQPKLEFSNDYPAGKILLSNLRLHGRDLSFEELRTLLKWNYKFDYVKAGLPEELVSELVDRLDDLGKIEKLWDEYSHNETWKPATDKDGQNKDADILEKAHQEALSALEKERETLIKVRETIDSGKGEDVRKNGEQVLEEFFAVSMEVKGLGMQMALSKLLQRYEEILSPYTTALSAEQVLEIFPLAIRKLTRIGPMSEYGWTWLIKTLHDQVSALKLTRSEVESIKQALGNMFDREIPATLSGDVLTEYLEIKKTVLIPYLERSWMTLSKPLKESLQKKIDDVEGRIEKEDEEYPVRRAKSAQTLAERQGMYRAKKDALEKKIELLEDKLGPYYSPKKHAPR